MNPVAAWLGLDSESILSPHAALISSVHGHLWTPIGGSRCRLQMSDLRVRVLETGLATYPDIPILCGRSERDPEDANTVTNPTVIVEVLSPSTETYDRGEKFEHYKQIPSLEHYVLVAHDRHAIDVWTRAPGEQWAHAGYVYRDAEERE